MVPAGLLMSGLRTGLARIPDFSRALSGSSPVRHARPTLNGLDPSTAPLKSPRGHSLSRSFFTPSALPLTPTHNSCHGQCRQYAAATQTPSLTLTAITSQRARGTLVRALRGAKVSGAPYCLCSPSSRHASPAPPTRHVGGSPIRQQSLTAVVRVLLSA